MNRRFVNFYFNLGPGVGGDDEAAAFVAEQTHNPWAYFAVFTPDGEYLAESEIYANKDEMFRFLRDLLDDHPEFAKQTPEEIETLARARSETSTPTEQLAGANLLAHLGEYEEALRLLRRIEGGGEESAALAAWCLMLQLERYQHDWEAHAQDDGAFASAIDATAMEVASDYRDDLLIERGQRWIAEDRFDVARDLLQRVTVDYPSSPRLAEAQFYAGVACWFAEDRDWAKFHWCWIVENRDEDRFLRRAYISAAAEAMPYPNYELRDFKADVGSIGVGDITRGYSRARAIYRRILPIYQGEVFRTDDDL